MKYELTDVTTSIDGVNYHRIRVLKDIPRHGVTRRGCRRLGRDRYQPRPAWRCVGERRCASER